MKVHSVLYLGTVARWFPGLMAPQYYGAMADVPGQEVLFFQRNSGTGSFLSKELWNGTRRAGTKAGAKNGSGIKRENNAGRKKLEWYKEEKTMRETKSGTKLFFP